MVRPEPSLFVHRAHRLEARVELGQALGGGAGAGELLVVEGERAVVVEDRHERPVEATLLRVASAARAWLSTASASHSSRVKPSVVAIRSAEMPWATMLYWSRRWWLLAVKPSTCSGRRAASCSRRRRRRRGPGSRRGCPAAAKLTACWPEPQKRLSVTPGASSDQPASSAAMRAMSIEWSPLPAPQPITTSSTSAVSNPLRSRSALSTWARIRCGWTLCSAPFSLPLPRGERTASMIQASFSMPRSWPIGVIPTASAGRLWRMAHDHSHGGGARAGRATPGR